MAYELVFSDFTHQEFHSILIDFGFQFEVATLGSELHVGDTYRHPTQPFEVEIALSLEGYRDAVTKDIRREAGNQIVVDDAFSEADWLWLDSVGDDRAEYLRRELWLLLKRAR